MNEDYSMYELQDQSFVLTPSGLVSFLSEIEELRNADIAIDESTTGLKIRIGESTYDIQSPSGSEVSVDDTVMEEIEEINDEGWDEVDVEFEDEPIEGGILKEALKTLAIGGLVRLTKDALLKS